MELSRFLGLRNVIILCPTLYEKVLQLPIIEDTGKPNNFGFVPLGLLGYTVLLEKEFPVRNSHIGDLVVGLIIDGKGKYTWMVQ